VLPLLEVGTEEVAAAGDEEAPAPVTHDYTQLVTQCALPAFLPAFVLVAVVYDPDHACTTPVSVWSVAVRATEGSSVTSGVSRASMRGRDGGRLRAGYVICEMSSAGRIRIHKHPVALGRFPAF
jgi:hypothetical protein